MQTLKLGSRGADVKTLQRHLNLYPDGIFGKITEETVRAFQSSRRDPATGRPLTVDGIVGPKTWQLILALPAAEYIPGSIPDEGYQLLKTNRPIRRIIIHCSATPEGRDYTVADIDRWHRERGYAEIGYHYVIYRDGRVLSGRDVNIIGAHTEGYNTGSIGICYIGGLEASAPGHATLPTTQHPSPTTLPSATVPAGSPAGKPKDTRTPEQRKALRTLVDTLRRMYPTATVHGHNEFSSKACPCFNVQKEL